jgi:hypothetical protein
MITGGIFFLPPGIKISRYDKDIYPSGQVPCSTIHPQIFEHLL